MGGGTMEMWVVESIVSESIKELLTESKNQSVSY